MAKKNANLVKVWNKDGLAEEHTPANATDLVRHGWSYAPMKNGRRTVINPNAQSDPESLADVLGINEGIDKSQVPGIDKLREEARSLGVAFDKRMGPDKLTELIEEARAVAEEDEGAEDDGESNAS